LHYASRETYLKGIIMSNVPRILAFSGSTRKASFNAKLVTIATSGARAAGAEVTELNLRDYPLPIFDQDLEAAEGLPGPAVALKKLFSTHQGFLISSPEYNSSLTALLKNTIDWVSRPAAGETSLAGFTGKVAALMSASPGALGGLRGLVHLRAILGNIGVIVLPEQIAVPKAHEAFDAQQNLIDEKQQAAIRDLGSRLTSTIRKLSV
jgi:NAD(P)H-dependent FMN reductase